MSTNKHNLQLSKPTHSFLRRVRQSPRFRVYAVVIVVVVLALVGYYAYRSRAAFGPGSVAVSTLTLGGGAKTVTDSNSTAGSVVQFAANSTGGACGLWVSPSTPNWPTASCTGPTVPLSSLTVVNGDVHLDSAWVAANPSKTYSGKDVHGQLYIDTPNVTVTNVAVHGDPSCPNESCATVQVGAVGGVVISHCLIVTQGDTVSLEPKTTSSSNKPGDVTVDSCDISGSTEGIRPDDGWIVTNNYIHDLNGVNGDHMDGIMFLGWGHVLSDGTTSCQSCDYNFHDITLKHNYIDMTNIGQGGYTGALFIDSGHFNGPNGNVTVTQNYFKSGQANIRIDGSYTFTDNAIDPLWNLGGAYGDSSAPKDCEVPSQCQGSSHPMVEIVSGNYDGTNLKPIFPPYTRQ